VNLDGYTTSYLSSTRKPSNGRVLLNSCLACDARGGLGAMRMGVGGGGGRLSGMERRFRKMWLMREGWHFWIWMRMCVVLFILLLFIFGHLVTVLQGTFEYDCAEQLLLRCLLPQSYRWVFFSDSWCAILALMVFAVLNTPLRPRVNMQSSELAKHQDQFCSSVQTESR